MSRSKENRLGLDHKVRLEALAREGILIEHYPNDPFDLRVIVQGPLGSMDLSELLRQKHEGNSPIYFSHEMQVENVNLGGFDYHHLMAAIFLDLKQLTPENFVLVLHEMGHAGTSNRRAIAQEYANFFALRLPEAKYEGWVEFICFLEKIEREAWEAALKLAVQIKTETGWSLKKFFNSPDQLAKCILEESYLTYGTDPLTTNLKKKDRKKFDDYRENLFNSQKELIISMIATYWEQL